MSKKTEIKDRLLNVIDRLDFALQLIDEDDFNLAEMYIRDALGSGQRVKMSLLAMRNKETTM
ncbi:hypothetical protein BMT54_01255 [Pasteurellaceae bacterium 15-036681]|nr:hypothetical protein BMT54_01255 [Pasteurellaceae bacterium 15-036681]